MILRAISETRPARLVGVMLLLAVFSLPFHIHAHIAAAQVKAECTCIAHGTRSELGPLPAEFVFLAVLAEYPVPPSRSSLVSRDVTGLGLIRAPPSL
jgi:hypothetical protein